MKLREGEPWMPTVRYAHSLRGLTVNLLVRDVEAALAFQREVLEAEVVYADPDVAVLRGHGSEWMLHADHTYETRALKGAVIGGAPRGGGVELRLHGRDPDDAQAVAERLGYRVLQSATDSGHGLREAYLLDDDGYVWVPDVPMDV